MSGIDVKTFGAAKKYAEMLALGGKGLQETVETKVNDYLAKDNMVDKIDTGYYSGTMDLNFCVGGFYNNGKEWVETTFNNFAKTDWIDAGIGTHIKIILKNNNYKYKILQAATKKSVVSDEFLLSDNYLAESVEITMKHCYIRIMVKRSDESNGITCDEVKNVLEIPINKETELKKSITSLNPLYRKIVYFDGDSICYGENSGGYSYPDIIAKENGMFLIKKAVSGTTVAIRDGYKNSILERIKSMNADYDYIVIEGGYNDCIQNVSLGTITSGYQTDIDESTFIGAMESICKFLCTNYFEKKKLFIVPHRTLNNDVNTYYDSAITVCKKWGIPIIDLRDECNLIPFIGESIQIEYFEGANTGVHPTEKGYEVFYVPKIVGKMKTL